METLLRPTLHLRQVQRDFPQLGRQVDACRAARGKALPGWPDWCFLPVSAAASLVMEGAPLRAPSEAQLFGIVCALATWRVTQGVYQVDPDLFEALWETPLTGQLPCQVLKHLPEWCLYVQCPQPVPLVERFEQEIGTPSLVLHGFYVHLEWDAGDGHEELRLLLDLESEDGAGLLPYAVHLGPWTLAEAMRQSAMYGAKSQQAWRLTGIEALGPPPASAAELETALSEVGQVMAAFLAPLVSLTLYLCSVAAEIAPGARTTGAPGNPQPQKTRRGSRYFPPPAPHVWEVGFRIGAILRAQTAPVHLQERSPQSTEEERARARPAPHIRRAHWHLFWTGHGRTVPRVRWLHPVLVARERGEIIPTIHPVE